MSVPARHVRYPFSVMSPSGGVCEEPDYDAYVAQLVRQVLMTARGERVCRPDFGAGVRRLVFAPLDATAVPLTRTLVYEALARWLAGIIEVERVEVSSEPETLRITLTYVVIARGERRVLDEEVAL